MDGKAKRSRTNDWDTSAVWVDAGRAVTVTQERHTEPQDETLLVCTLSASTCLLCAHTTTTLMGGCPSVMSVRACACVGRTLLPSARGLPRETEENAAAAQLTHSTPRSLSAVHSRFHSRSLALMLSLALSTLSVRQTRGLTHARMRASPAGDWRPRRHHDPTALLAGES